MTSSRGMVNLAIGTAIAAAMVAPAWAQPVATPPTTPNEERPLEADNVIIVTAQKREQSLQDVPAAVTVLTGEALIGDFLSDAKDLQRIAPTLTFGEGSSPATSAISLRGIGTSVFDAAVEPTISVIVDGVVLGRNSQAFVDLIDVERIEILKGPQGTLFGKNASGGVINVVTKRPSDDFEIDAEFLAAENDEYQARASVSAPIGPSFGGRLTGFYKTVDGHIPNTFDNRVFNGSESWGVRGKLEFEPSPDVNVYLIADYRESDSQGSEETALLVGSDGLATALAAQGIVPGPENRQAFTFDPILTETKDYGVSLQVDADVGAVTLTSQTAYRRFDLVNSDDVDLVAVDPTRPGAGLITNSSLEPFGGVFLAGPANIFQSSDSITEQFSTEFRVTSEPGAFEYVAGLFWSHVAINNDFRRDSDACLAPAGITLAPLVAGAPCVPSAIIPGVGIPDIIPLSQLLAATGGPPTFGDVRFDVDTDNFAAFGQGTYKLTDRFGVVGGLRVQHDVVDSAARQNNRTAALGLMPAPFFARGKVSDTAVSGKAGVQYEFGPTNENLVYATYSRGYKGPSVDFNPLGDQVRVEPETSDGFEVGLKTLLFDNRLLLNLAAFWVDYSDLQEEAFDSETGFFLLTNVGAVRTRGVEADFFFEPFENFTLNGGIAYVDASVREFPFGPCFTQDPAPTCDPTRPLAPGEPARFKDLSGEGLPNSPDLKFNLTGDLEVPFGTRFKFGARSTVSYQSGVNFSLAQDPNTVQEGYALVDASVRFGDVDDRWLLSLFVKNAFDQNFRTSLFQDFTSFTRAQILQRTPLAAERRFGASFRVQY